MQSMAQRLHSGELRGSTAAPITDIVSVGIGGSEFGTRLLCDALQDLVPPGRRLHFVSSVDALEIARLIGHVDPASTLFVVSSKSFSTVETLLNARTLRAWFDERGLDATNHWFAVTGNREAAEAFGIPSMNIFDVPDWIGGRFSPWGAVGLPAALYLGWPMFERWLQGGHAADLHFVRTPVESNVPIRLALENVWSSTFLQCPSRCVVAYDGRLAQFLPWLQQLEMESNGKGITEDGLSVDYPTAPVVWGGLGNNGQHTYFQLLREGTGQKAITIVGTRTASMQYPEHAAELEANREAQVRALSARGSTRSFNSVNQLLLEDFGPYQLGALMATLEHATACSGWLWGVNSFDQPGVEFGKKVARELRAGQR
jgi:glucose-6-phosphate isomerase